MKKLLLALFAVSTLILAPASAAVAQDNLTDNQTDAAFHDRCKVIKVKLTAKINSFEKRRESHLRHYKSIRNKVQNIVERLDNAGYNTEPITVLQPGLDRRITDFEVNSQQFITDLKQARRAACVSPEAYQNELQEARESLKETRQSAEEIRNYLHDELIPTIRKAINNPPSDEALNDSLQ